MGINQLELHASKGKRAYNQGSDRNPYAMRKSTRRSLSDFSAELVRRKVYPVVAAYAIVAWILLQVGEVTFEPLGLPDWVMKVLVIAVIAGVPIAAIVAWMFDITPTGIRRDQFSRSADLSAGDVPSIAVLPFTDLSPDKDQGYFCDGVAEEILNALARIDKLRVVARMSSFGHGNSGHDAKELGKELDADAILEGSVRKSDDQLRITARLINTANGIQFWSKTFDRELKDIFSIQDDIATSIAESLLNTLIVVKATTCKDVVAYEYYLRGRQFLNRFRKVDLEFARQLFEQAIERDSGFAQAWASYADCFSLEVMYADPTPAFKGKAHEACRKALELGPELAEAHASCGLAALVSGRYDEAEARLNEAIQLNPQLYEAYYYFGRTRFHQGDLEGAAALFEKAASINPAEYQARLLRVQILRGIGREQEAKAYAKKAIKVVEKHLEWHPGDTRALCLGPGSLILLGEIERAEKWLRRALQIAPDDSIVLYNVACNFATMGKVDEAIDYLEQGVATGTINAEWARNDADLVQLQGHPRFEALMKRIQE